jgi:hypothetical protein
MLQVGIFRSPKHRGKFRPGVGRAHVHDPHRLDTSAWRLDPKEARGLAALHAAPEFQRFGI